MYYLYLFMILFYLGYQVNSDKQTGPDPWNYHNDLSDEKRDHNVPPDLRVTAKQRTDLVKNNLGLEELFFRMALGVILKGGQLKYNNDESIDVSLQLKFDSDKWAVLENYMKSTNPFTEDMYRRSIGYVQDAICKPTVTERIAVAWGEYIQMHLIEYKFFIISLTGILATILGVTWLGKHVSYKHLTIFVFIVTYLYEAFTSYKEVEQQEVKLFLNAINSCNWRFWSSNCEVPHPDPLIFFKYMNPMKIGVRMFTNLISEPMITVNGIVKLMITDITDGLWFPFDKIVSGILLLTFNLFIVMFLIMILYNYILNIPFSFFGLRVGGHRNRSVFRNSDADQESISQKRNIIRERDGINDTTLNKLLDVFAQALDNKQNKVHLTPQIQNSTPSNNFEPKLKRSLSAGRLLDYFQSNTSHVKTDFKKRKTKRRLQNGGGDGKD